MIPDISIIIPTLNRYASLCETLGSLQNQTLPKRCFEVIVVDDGSTDKPYLELRNNQAFSLSLRYIYQENKGGVTARNRGIENANGDLVIFLDDDMTAEPDYLEALFCHYKLHPNSILRGQLVPWQPENITRYHHVCNQALIRSEIDGKANNPQLFASNNIAIPKKLFKVLGFWKEVIPLDANHKGGIWADLEFACRARASGYELLTIADARVIHRDNTTTNLVNACKRMEDVSSWVVPVIQEYPELLEFLPMLKDKLPIDLKKDDPKLVLRKIARIVSSHKTMLLLLHLLARFLETSSASDQMMEILYRWIIGGYIFRGYRVGLHLYG